jgi:autotransporter-associated beta strand protein
VTFTSPLPYFSNTYAGDTVVNQGTLNISNAVSQLGGIMVPGNLILNNANATQATHNGSIASTSNVTLNGGSVLTLVGQNTFQSVTFNNIGGTTTPQVTGGTLFVTGAITATNDNYATTPTIASALELNGQSKTITVNGASPVGLILSGAVQNVMNSATPAGLIKAGTGSLVLSGASTFAGGVQLNAGSLIVGANSTGSTAGTGVTSGPLGTGVLTIGAGTSLLPASAPTLANNLVVGGNFTIGGAATNLTLNGTVSLGGAARTITVLSPQVTTTFGGIISGSAGGLTKVGNGILVLTPQTTGALSASGAASNATMSGSADLTLSAPVATGVAVGMPVSGPGIAFGTTVASVAGSVVTLSKNAVATAGNGTFAFGTTQTYVPSSGASGTSSITVSLAEAANLVVGSTVTGVGVAASSTVTAVDTATGVVTLNNALTAAVTGQNLTFGGATATASFNDYAGTTTVSGGLLRLGNLGALPSTTALVVLSGGTLELQASTTVASLAGDSSTTGGLITASGTSGTIQLNVNGSANTAFGGAITNNVGSTFNFNKQGSGTLTLGGPNTFTGATTVSGGTLTTLAGSLAGTSGITVNGAILAAADFNSGATLALNATGRATISGAGQNVGAVTNANVTDANALNFTATTGTITLASLSGAGKTTFGSAATVTGAISDGVVNVTGALIAGSITGGANTITGAATVTTVNGGTLTVGGVATVTTLTTGTLNANGATAAVTTLNGGNIALGSSTALTVSDGTHAGVISGATGTLTKSGAGTLILSGANTFGGAITISAGTLQIGAGSTTGSIGAGAIANSGILAINRSDNLSFANVISGTGSLTKSAAGTLTLATANTFDGGVTIAANGGTVIVGHNNALGTGQVTLAGNTAQLTLADGITVANPMFLTSTGGVQARTLRLQAGATSATYAGAISNLSTNTLAFTVDAGGTLTVSGIISGNGLSKTGAGTAILSGTNTYTGATTVSAGTLQVASESNLGAVPGSFVAGQLALGEASTQGILKSTGTTSLSANRGVTLAAGGGAFDVAASTTLTIASAVTGTGALTKSGAGLLDLKMGTPQYGGTTTINGGTLRFTNVADLGAVSTMVFNINNGSTLEFQSSVGGSNRTVLNNKTFTFGASGGGTINFNGGNNLTQNGVHNFVTTGGAKNRISQTNGGLINNQSSGNTVFNVADGTDAVDLELSAQWVNGTLTKAGLGTMAITGVHTGNFDLDIDAGVLEIGGSASLNGGTFTAAITNDGTFRYGSSAAQTMSGIISGTGALTKLGSGNLTLSGANTFTGATLVSAGTLTVSAGALAGTTGITVNGATLAAANYNLAATLALDATATATISGETLTFTGAVTNAGTTDNALNFSASTGIITLTSLAGAGKTRFGSDADVLGGISVGTVTVVGALGANITGGTVTAGSLAGAVSGGNVTVTNLLTGGVSAGTVNAGSLTGNISGGAVTLTSLLMGDVSGGTVSAAALTGNVSAGAVTLMGALTGNVLAGAGTVSAGSMAGNVASSVTISGLLNGEITAGTNSLGSLASASVTGGTNTITGAATVTTVNGGTTTVGGVATITTLTTGTLTFNGASGSIGTLTDGTFNLNGAAATVGTLSAGTINLAASTALTVDSGTFSGSLAGSGSLIKATSGILTLTGANASFTGSTTINAGELIIQNAGSLGTSAITVASGAILDLGGLSITNAITATPDRIRNGPTAASPAVVAALSGTNSINTVLTGTTGLAKDGSGELSLTTPNFFTGAVTANTAGAVISAAYLADNSSSLGASALTDPTKLVLGNGATLEFTGTTATTTSRSFTVNGAAALAVDAAAAPLTFSSSSIMALDPADSTPELKLTAFNSGVNRFEAQISADDIAAGRGLSNLAIDGTGKWVLGGSANRFKGDIRVDVGGGGTLGFESGSLGMGSTYASSDIVVANGSTLAWSGSGNTDDISARLQVPDNATAKLDLGANNVTFATAPSMGSGASLQKQGSGTLNVSFSAPTLNVAVSSGTLSVNGSLGAITLTNGATLGGAGTIASATVVNGAILSPGNSPGTLNATSLTFVGGSYFDWQVQDATDLTNGFDKINLSGSLDLTGASASNRVKFRITSLLGAGNGTTLGEPLNFAAPGVAAQPTVFQFGTVAAGGSGVLLNSGLNISDVFEIDVTGFKYSDGSSSNAGLWSIDWNVGTGAITLTAVPEPSTYGFAMGALALAAAAIRRRKRQATKA